jgi:hypothetical protein
LFHSDVLIVQPESPRSVQILPFRAHELRARILGAGDARGGMGIKRSD